MTARIAIAPLLALGASCAGAERPKPDKPGPQIELIMKRDPLPPPSMEGFSVRDTQGSPRPISYPEAEQFSPKLPLGAGEEGTAIVRVLISPTGEVWDVELMDEKPREIGLGDAAVRYVRQVKFTPGTARGRPIQTRVQYTVKFR